MEEISHIASGGVRGVGKAGYVMVAATGALSLKERQRREREQLILQAADDLLLEKGYHEMSMDDIAARVGVSKGTLYLHFSSKEDLVFATLEGHMSAFGAAMDSILEDDLTPRAKLKGLIELVFKATAGRLRLQTMEALTQSPELRSRLLERRESMKGYLGTLSQRIGAVIEAGKAAGEFDTEIPTAVLVGLFSNLLNPHTFRRAEMSMSEDIPPETLAGYVCRFFFRGAAADVAVEGGE